MQIRSIASNGLTALLTISCFLIPPGTSRKVFAGPILESNTVSDKSTDSVLKKDALGVSLRSNGMETRAEIWRDGVIRVTHRPVGLTPRISSLAVVAKPEKTPWTMKATSDAVLVTTRRVKVRIGKSDGSVGFFNLESHPILQEYEDGTWLSNVTVGSAKETVESGQKFRLQGDESIYGLGQHPNGTSLDYTGSNIRLLQENTKVGIPMVLSSKGYALFWDNPAVTNVDVGKIDPHAIQWRSEAGEGVEYYFFAGPEPDQAIAEYRWLTGSAPMFPL